MPRERSASSSRSLSRGGKRPKGVSKKDAKKKKRRRCKEDEEPPKSTTAPAASPKLSDRDLQSDLAAKRGSWREEMAEDKGIDEDTVAEGFTPMETDEDVDRKLAESRARREALIAKWVNRGEGPEEGFTCPDTNTSLNDKENESDSDRDVDAFFAEAQKKQDDRPQQTEQSIEEAKKINRFILEHRAEHDGDMFDESKDQQEKLNKGVDASSAIGQTGAGAGDWNDKEGYYLATVGEVMDGRYSVVEDMCGKGVFSSVVKAKDQDGSMVAIKVMRTNDMMRKAAEKEIDVLQRLGRADKKNTKHCIRLFRTFDYREHLCLVFECMWDNLRVALKKYTKNKGMSLRAVRAYTKQLLTALAHIHRCEVIHADIKPDNILISAGHNLVKICDLGSTVEFTEIEPTPYLVSRFYRAPEIILGAKYGPQLDTFALGATFFELFTGHILFPGKSNNDMLRQFMDFKGKLPVRLIKSGSPVIWKQHFDENLDFKYVDFDKLTRKTKVRTITDCSAKKSIVDMIMQRVGPEKQRSEVRDDQLYVKKAKQFADLLGQMTMLDPEKRASPQDLLQHTFLTENWPTPKGEKDASAAKKT
mmetsp:Transcript_124193/g.215282  ORF Transcript_124193/g.215282 Transcript_124193/m.215282 type:complete len:589 (+) Transcript_124193:137-1903(+)